MEFRTRSFQWLVALALLLFARPASAQVKTDGTSDGTGPGFSTGSSSWEGLSEFVRVVERASGADLVRVRATLDYDELQPGDALIILHPEATLDGESLTRFLGAGGRLALVDDFGSSQRFLSRFGVQRLNPPDDPVLRVDDNPNLAIATPVSRVVAGAERGRHPMTAQVDLVVTNHAIALAHPDLTPVLEIEGSHATLPIAVTGVAEKRGRLVVIGDPSIFINLMLRYPGNRAFATGLAEYLQKRDAGAARGRVWIVSGAFQQRGSFGAPSLKERLNEALDDAAESLRNIESNGLPPLLALILGALGVVWLLRFELFDQLNLPGQVLPSFARPAPVAAQNGLLARAEVLAAPATTPLLAVLELGTALEETLADRWGAQTDGPGGTDRSAALARAGVRPADALAIARISEELTGYRRRVAEGKAPRPSEGDLKRIHGEVMRLLDIIHTTKRRSQE